MRYFCRVAVLLLVALVSGVAWADDASLALVSDNPTSNIWMMLMPSDTAKIVTGATYTLVREGPYATDPSTISTDESGLQATDKQDSGDKSPFFDGRWVFTGSRTFSEWSGGQWISIIIDLKKPYPVAKAQLWSLVDTQCFTESYEVLTSDNGTDFTSRGVFNNKSPREAMMFVRTDGYLPEPVTARYIQVRIHRLPGAYQQQIGELAIWAVKPGMTFTPQAQKPAPVKFDVQMVGSGVAKLDLSKFNADVVAWRVYRSDKSAEDLEQNAKPIATMPGSARNYLLYPVKPKSQTWFSVSAIYNGSGEESPRTEPVKLVTPGVFDCNTFGDMLAVNHFPNGGGSHIGRLNEQEWQIVALDMLARTPIKSDRWWRQDEFWVKMFYERGINMLVSSSPETANPLGIYGFSLGNEPDMIGIPPETFLETLKAGYKSIKAANPVNVVTAPTSGTEQHSIDWLESLYKLGAKDYFDVLDLHPYCKTSGGHEVPPGIPAGAPEALLSDIPKVKAIMAKYGDQDKPIIATELGYATTIHGNPGGLITKEIQSQYIVRALVLCNMLGFKRVYWYSFFDEGTSIYDPEHNYGLIDYYMQAKPAYYSLITLGEQIGKGVLIGAVKGAKNPVYGYTYKVGDEFVSVLWDGGGDSAASISIRDSEVTVVDLLGEKHTAVPTDGILKIKLSPGAIYIHSRTPISVKSAKRVAPREDRKVTISVPKDVFILNAGEKAKLGIKLANGLLDPVTGYAELLNSKGKALIKQRLSLKSGEKTSLALSFNPGASAPALLDYKLRVVYSSELDSVSTEKKIWVRTLAKESAGKVTITKMSAPGVAEPFVVLSNSQMEVSIAPGIGGRIIEIIDRKTRANQLRIDYSQLKGLPELQWAYTYWDTLNDELKNAKFAVELKASSAILTAHGTGIDVRKTYTMDGIKNGFNYDIAVTNSGDENKDVTYHCHPEYNVGGTADNIDDVILLPTKSGVTKIQVWLGLGIRTHNPLSEGWYAVMDKKQKTVFGQRFDLNTIDDVAVWLGESFYNLELKGKRLTIGPGKTQTIKTSFFMQHGEKALDFSR